MKNNTSLFILLFLCSFITFSQDIEKDLYLKHSVRQDGESYNFTVLSSEKKSVYFHDKSKYYYWFKAQKVICTQGGSSGLVLNGKFEAFYDNKQLARKGSFHKGLKNGEWLYWRENGTLMHVEHWKKGKLFGQEIFYDEKGIALTTVDYQYRSYSRKTADSLIISNYTGTKKTIYTKDNKGEFTSIKSFKNGVEVEPKKKFKLRSIFKKKEESTDNKKDKTVKETKEKKKLFGFLKKEK